VHAVPQLVLPYYFEGPMLAGKLTEQGAGLTVPADVATGQAVRDAVLRLLREPAFGERAAALRDEIHAMPAPNQLADQLPELTASYRTSR
jgi:UDP:flavonoid glycosyltransferase YjiC (YdhE family)